MEICIRICSILNNMSSSPKIRLQFIFMICLSGCWINPVQGDLFESGPGIRRVYLGDEVSLVWSLTRPVDLTAAGSYMEIYRNIDMILRATSGGCDNLGESHLSCLTQNTSVGFSIGGSGVILSDAETYGCVVKLSLVESEQSNGEASIYLYRVPSTPSITGNTPSVAGNSLTLQCSAASQSIPASLRPVMEYTWSTSIPHTSSGSTVTAGPLTRDHDGETVTCTANEQGSTLTSESTVTISVKSDLFESGPGIRRVYLGDEVSLVWSLTRPVVLTAAGSYMEVYHNIDMILSTISDGCNNLGESRLSCVTQNTSVGFSIGGSGVILNDAGAYRCVVKLFLVESEESNGEASIFIYRAPSTPTITGNTPSVAGVSLTLQCSATSQSLPASHRLVIEYTWSISLPHTPSGSTVTVGPLTRDHAGTTVTCTANEQGSTLTSESNVTVSVKYPPASAQLHANKVTVVEGMDDLLMTCQVPAGDEGKPDIYTYQWRNLDANFAPSNSGMSLTISKNALNADLHDGTWQCTPSNAAGSGTPVTKTITVHAAPSLEPDGGLSGPYEVPIDGDLSQMFCSFRAKPKADITWTFNGETSLPAGIGQTSSSTQQGKYYITVSTLRWQGSDAARKASVGQYVCEADNGVGQSVQSGPAALLPLYNASVTWYVISGVMSSLFVMENIILAIFCIKRKQSKGDRKLKDQNHAMNLDLVNVGEDGVTSNINNSGKTFDMDVANVVVYEEPASLEADDYFTITDGSIVPGRSQNEVYPSLDGQAGITPGSNVLCVVNRNHPQYNSVGLVTTTDDSIVPGHSHNELYPSLDGQTRVETGLSVLRVVHRNHPQYTTFDSVTTTEGSIVPGHSQNASLDEQLRVKPRPNILDVVGRNSDIIFEDM